ncbi:hypothetical protein PV04_09678 [Phialophora macrospora]|uniref:SCP domain-containing protein n=1 Tax=Phialophora macrospora TaxID=1851006 RepID=A0A0D2F9S3_9EURO|nr:hypothetical protein PV04_09678 [Phialophora macrospora]
MPRWKEDINAVDAAVIFDNSGLTVLSFEAQKDSPKSLSHSFAVHQFCISIVPSFSSHRLQFFNMKISTTFILLAASGQALGLWNNWLRDVAVTETVTRVIQSCPCNGEEHVVTPVPRSEGHQLFRKPGPPFGPPFGRFFGPFGPHFNPRPGKPLTNAGPIPTNANKEPWADWFGAYITKSIASSSASTSSPALSSPSSAGPIGASTTSGPNGYTGPNPSTSLSSSTSITSSSDDGGPVGGSNSASSSMSTSGSSSLGPTGGSTTSPTSTTLAASSTTSSSSTSSTSSSTDPSTVSSSSSLPDQSTTESPVYSTTLLTTTSGASSVTTTSSSSSSSSDTTTTSPPGAVVTVDVSSLSPIDAILVAHNIHRSNHTATNLTWSESLASIAADIAATCVYDHNTTAGGGGYGQNIGAGYTPDRVPSMIGNSMYNTEMPYYPLPYGQDNPDMSDFNNWGHFSQIVWKDTSEVGCATQYCPDGLANTGSGVSPYFTVCNYSPPGNIQGAYSQVGAPLGQPITEILPN